MLPVLVILALAFVALFVLRMGGAHRYRLAERWPALVLAGAALMMLLRGAIWPAIGLGGLAVAAWLLWPTFNTRLQKYDSAAAAEAEDPEDQRARAVLGISRGASESDIRRAYRAKMTSAHPDRGGTNAEAARLAAARDRLLRKKR